jgi:hypothetical protein
LVVGPGGIIQTRDELVPVLSTFGIIRYTGYVVGVSNYAATLNVVNNDAGDLVALVGTSVRERDSHEVEIMFAPSEGRRTDTLRTTKEALGLPALYDGYEGDLSLLGRKIVVFESLRANVRVTLPDAIVVGEKN